MDKNLDNCLYCIYICAMAKKQMISFRFEPRLIEHAKNHAEKRRKTLTDYISDLIKEDSKFKPIINHGKS